MEIKVKACLLLEEMKSQGNGMREVLLFLGKMLVLRKASFIGHRDYLTAVLEPDGHAPTVTFEQFRKWIEREYISANSFIAIISGPYSGVTGIISSVKNDSIEETISFIFFSLLSCTT